MREITDTLGDVLSRRPT